MSHRADAVTSVSVRSVRTPHWSNEGCIPNREGGIERVTDIKNQQQKHNPTIRTCTVRCGLRITLYPQASKTDWSLQEITGI